MFVFTPCLPATMSIPESLEMANSFLEVMFDSDDGVLDDGGLHFAGVLGCDLVDAIDVVDELAETVEGVQVVAFLLSGDVADCIDGGTDSLPVYALSTQPVLSSLVEIFRQRVEKADARWQTENWRSIDELGAFDDALTPVLVYERLLVPVDRKYLEYLVNPWQGTHEEYEFHYIIQDGVQRRFRDRLRRWRKVTAASKKVRGAVMEWAARPGGPLATLARRRFETDV